MACLDFITSPVYILATKDGERLNGMTAAWLMQTSFSPAMVAVSVAPERFTYGLIKKAGKFSISILDESQKDIARKFGTASGRDVDKYKGVAHEFGENGLPVIVGCASWIECSLDGEAESGDHRILFGRVLAQKVDASKKTLLFRMSDYY